MLRPMTSLRIAFTLLALAIPAAALAEPAPPLFASVAGEPLKGTLKLPLTELLRRQAKRETVAATLAIEGEEQTFAVEVTPRGKSRLERCRWPVICSTRFSPSRSCRRAARPASV